MKRDRKRPEDYVYQVRDNTQQYLDQVVRENQKLRDLVSILYEERERSEKELVTLRERLESQQLERNRLKKQLDEIGSENQFVSAQYRDVEKQNNDLANLYVASYRLHETLDPKDVIAVIEEIVVNLIGSEQIAIFELDEEDSSLRLLSSLGIATERFETVPLDRGMIGRAAASGALVVAGEEDPDGRLPEESDLTVCIPLKVDDEITGVIAVFQLLEQKPHLVPLDFELVDLLATHAATALFCSRALANSSEASV